MSATLALLALLAQSDGARPRVQAWEIARHSVPSVVTGYVGYLSRDTGRVWVEVQASRSGILMATVGVHDCETQRSLDLDRFSRPRPSPNLLSGPRRPAAVQTRLSRLLTEVSRACRVARPSDRLFFRGFRRAFIDFERADT